MSATAIAHPNVALIKYWGKRDRALNLPAVGSISITLHGLTTRTTVDFSEGRRADSLILDGAPVDPTRVAAFLDRLRALAGRQMFAAVRSSNNFPTGAGLASSSSGFAALALAAATALDLHLPLEQLSALARQGSGSAPRSLLGGFVEMRRGVRPDGADAIAVQLAPETHWQLEVLVAVTSQEQKPVSSTDAMQRSAATSPFYDAWCSGAAADLDAMRRSIAERDLTRLGELTEHSCLKMHAVAQAARPGVLFWSGVTIEILHAVRALRRQGTEAYFTVDAGPQVKVLCLPVVGARVEAVLKEITGVVRVVRSGPGPGAHLEGAAR